MDFSLNSPLGILPEVSFCFLISIAIGAKVSHKLHDSRKMRTTIIWRASWAVIGLLSMGLFFWALAGITGDGAPLWLQVAVSVGGVGAWLKFGDRGPNLVPWIRDKKKAFIGAWWGWIGPAIESFVAIAAVIFLILMIVFYGFKKTDKKEAQWVAPDYVHRPQMMSEETRLESLERLENERTH